MQSFTLSTIASQTQKSIFRGPISHQVSSLNSLHNQIYMLKEENERLKKLNFLAEDKQNLENQLAVARSEASSNLNKKVKSDEELSRANEEIKRLREIVDRAKAAEEKFLL